MSTANKLYQSHWTVTYFNDNKENRRNIFAVQSDPFFSGSLLITSKSFNFFKNMFLTHFQVFIKKIF